MRLTGRGVLASALAMAIVQFVAACGGDESSSSDKGGSTAASLGSVSLVTGAKNIIAADLPFVVAKEKGYYDDAGLDVDITFGDGYDTALRAVASGQGEYAETDLASITKAVDEGLPVQSVAIYSQTSPAGLVFNSDDPIKSPDDLRGKSVAYSAGSGSGLVFDAWLKANGLTDSDFTRVVVPGHQKPIVFAQGQVDAYVGLGYDDLPEARKTAGKDAVGFYYFADDGIKVPGVAVGASASEIADNPDRVKAFLEATARGYQDAVDDVQGSIALAQKLLPTTDAKILTQQWEIFISASGAQDPGSWGVQEEEAWSQTVEVFSEKGADGDLSAYYTNDFLPGK